MPEQTEEKKQYDADRKWLKKKAAEMAVFIAVAVLAWMILKPAYHRYLLVDWTDSCYYARLTGAADYQERVEELLASGADADTIDYRQIAEEAFSERYQVTVSDDLTAQGICRAGGTTRIVIDPVTHELTVYCSEEGHEVYRSDS